MAHQNVSRPSVVYHAVPHPPARRLTIKNWPCYHTAQISAAPRIKMHYLYEISSISPLATSYPNPSHSHQRLSLIPTWWHRHRYHHGDAQHFPVPHTAHIPNPVFNADMGTVTHLRGTTNFSRYPPTRYWYLSLFRPVPPLCTNLTFYPYCPHYSSLSAYSFSLYSIPRLL